ncbi:MAG: S41 family peptidase [Chloroflexi bacterium]|nr:S41 family peptidase [Chloroflexota bacterium]
MDERRRTNGSISNVVVKLAPWIASRQSANSGVRRVFARITRVGLVTALGIVLSCAPTDPFTPRMTSDVGSTPTVVAVSDTPVPATGMNAGLRPITPEQGLGLVANAWLVFLNEYVEQLDYPKLLAAAWNGFVGGLPSGTAIVDAPEFTGADPQADLNSFQTAYLAQAASLGGTSPRQSGAAYNAIRGMVKEIGDCHTGFTTPTQLAEQNQRMDGTVRFAGIGIRIKRKTGEPAVVYELIEGGAAGKAGIKPGDALLKADGVDLSDMPLDEIAARIRGKEGSSVKLTIAHASDNKPRDISIIRVAISEAAVESRLVGNNRVAYVRMNSFSASAQDEALGAIGTMQAKATNGIVIDLRTNGGGDLNVFLSFLSKFLKDGPFGFEVGRKGDRIALGPDGTFVGTKVPMIVLVSDSTASAAELFSVAVQRYKVARVVGTKTAGCVGVGSRFGLPDGSAITVTTRKLIGPEGENLNKVGVAPDEVVEVTRANMADGKDPQLEKALRLLGA